MSIKDDRQDFINRLVMMKGEAFQLGLIRTGHALDVATTQAGWELADILTGKQANLDLRRDEANKDLFTNRAGMAESLRRRMRRR